MLNKANFIRKFSVMSLSLENNNLPLSVYRKALDIFKISRSVAAYFTHNKDIIRMDVSSNPSDHLSGLLVTKSLQLAPGVASVHSTKDINGKLKKIKNILKAANNLSLQCRKMEFSGIKEIEFLHLLRQEIHQFEYLLSDWLKRIKLQQPGNKQL